MSQSQPSPFIKREPSEKQVRQAVEDTVDQLATARKSRRKFLRNVGAGAVTAAAVSATGGVMLGGSAAQAQTVNDGAVLNFALNLEYLEAEFYSFATTGASITAQGVAVDGVATGANSPAGGPVITKGGSTVVPFTTPAIRDFALELAADERNHVVALRTRISQLGGAPVARPTIDLLNSFNAAASAAGLGASFDPFASELNFLLGSFIFEDVGVTAYKGGSPLLRNRQILEDAAGILAVEAYHAAAIRLFVLQAGAASQAQAISNLRDNVDALDGSGTPGDDRDQGIVDPTNNPVPTGQNLVPTDALSIAFSRTPASVLKIVYLGGPTAISNGSATPGGGFLPNGANGTLR
jgi:hypothetical protein